MYECCFPYRFTLHSDDTLLTLKGKISLHNGLPLSLIHVQHDGQEVKYVIMGVWLLVYSFLAEVKLLLAT